MSILGTDTRRIYTKFRHIIPPPLRHRIDIDSRFHFWLGLGAGIEGHAWLRLLGAEGAVLRQPEFHLYTISYEIKSAVNQKSCLFVPIR